MKKPTSKKLSLNKETLKNLSTRELDKVAGGSAVQTSRNCGPSNAGC
jgi:natural product precursor